MNKQVLIKRVLWVLGGTAWPFVIAAILTTVNVHKIKFTEWCGHLAFVIMGLGLTPIFVFLFRIFPKKWHGFLKGLLAAIITCGIGYGLFILVILFGFWLYFALGGQC